MLRYFFGKRDFFKVTLPTLPTTYLGFSENFFHVQLAKHFFLLGLLNAPFYALKNAKIKLLV